MMFDTEIYPWVVLINYAITFGMCLFGTILSLLLLLNSYRYKHIIKFSPTINLYFCSVFIAGFITVLNTAYLITMWRSNETNYNSHILYISGAAAAQLLASIPVVEFFTVIDRCLYICYPFFASSSRMQYITSTLSITIIFGILASYNISNDIIAAFPTDPFTPCRTFGCQKSPTANFNTALMKSVIAICNVFVALLLGYLVKTRVFASMTIKRVHSVVLRMAIATIFLDFVPNLAAMIGLLIGSKLLNIFGPYSATLTSTNIAISTFMYWKTLQRSVKEKSKTSIVYFKSQVVHQ